MPAALDLLGQRFTRLLVIAETSRTPSKKRRYLCQCDCGNQAVTQGAHLRSGHTKSCGCVALEVRTKHGACLHQKETREYRIWRAMFARCYDMNSSSYKRYGARGIKIVDRWHTFPTFLKDMGICPPLHSLERLNNDGPYSPTNCIWATRNVQMRNTRRNRLVTIGGITLTLIEWAEQSGISYSTLCSRLERGWSSEKLLGPLQHGRHANAMKLGL